jgi:chromosome partitioning protein
MARGFDLIAVDCPGSLEGHDVLSAVLKHTDFALVPYDHQAISLPPTVKTCRLIGDQGTPYAVVINNVDPRLGGDYLLNAYKTIAELGFPHFRTPVRQYRAWQMCMERGLPSLVSAEAALSMLGRTWVE